MSSITIRDTAHWHQLRSENVGASESAALFNMLPWLTRWQLHLMKSGRLPQADLENNDVVKRGQHFEPAIAGYAAEKFGITLQKVRRYITSDDTPGMGCSLDYEQIGTGSLIPTEIKWSQFNSDWEWERDEITQIPDYYLVQVLHQLACCPSAPYGQIIAFVGGDVRRMIVHPDDRIIAPLKAAIAKFWDDVRAGNEPEPDLMNDAGAIRTLAALRAVSLDGLDDDPVIKDLCCNIDRLATEYKRTESEYDAARADLLRRMMKRAEELGAPDEPKLKGTVDGRWNLSATMVAGSEGQLVTPEMVGQRVGARKGYRKLTISEIKRAKETS